MDNYIFYNKYIKYKNKYINYKINIGGAGNQQNTNISNIDIKNKIITLYRNVVSNESITPDIKSKTIIFILNLYH